MSKFGICVGEEFPIDDAAPRPPSEPDGETHCRRGRWHRVFHWAARLTFLALMVSAIVWLLRPREFDGVHGPYMFHPGHHHVVFPFLLLALLFLVAWRRGRHHHHHWHRHPHRGEGA